MQPGDTITPGQSQGPDNQAEQKFDYQPEASPAPVPPQLPPQESAVNTDTLLQENTFAEWTASEYIDHQKSAEWYVALVLVVVLLSCVVYLVTRDWIGVVVVLIATGLFGVSGAKKPRTLEYRITNDGVRIANKLYPYEDLKLFSAVHEGGISSIQILPLRRFMPALSIYYPPDMEEKIFAALSNFLPHEENQHDPVDRLMKRLRF